MLTHKQDVMGVGETWGERWGRDGGRGEFCVMNDVAPKISSVTRIDLSVRSSRVLIYRFCVKYLMDVYIMDM